MRLGTIFTIFLCAVILGITLRRLYKIWKEARKSTPDDKLYQLLWKIEGMEVNEESEKYLSQEIEKLKQDEEQDQEKVERLNDIFKTRFEEIHYGDE
jgi:hypothetical protein